MEQFIRAIRQMISISDTETDSLLGYCYLKSFSRKTYLSTPGKICNEVFFITKGISRNILIDNEGVEHTTNFTIENQFIADYASFLQKTPSIYYLQALESIEAVVMPREAIEWGYHNLKQGDRLGRLIAEYYFVYHDNQIRKQYFETPQQRYETITQVFPDIHNRAPQHMIASYLGITSVHLSRLKRTYV
ncbi:Crp/Fnr family transcriptional regulator [Emticicia agri]|uniref:Crp/Fnr family transcriptional regulator n=1 Tax=Emticicia agri TaxID=2492393 RepID=A0A4Q5LV27_9BACT|nr:cyclic nucleotide-binding domain-containing protein [Emticicia agri]RYU93379.1 Crp/Fnr family transcriptional regulator [Emticicia agri]